MAVVFWLIIMLLLLAFPFIFMFGIPESFGSYLLIAITIAAGIFGILINYENGYRNPKKTKAKVLQKHDTPPFIYPPAATFQLPKNEIRRFIVPSIKCYKSLVIGEEVILSYKNNVASKISRQGKV